MSRATPIEDMPKFAAMVRRDANASRWQFPSADRLKTTMRCETALSLIETYPEYFRIGTPHRNRPAINHLERLWDLYVELAGIEAY